MITYLRSNLIVFIVQVNQRIEALRTVFVIIKSDAECLFSAYLSLGKYVKRLFHIRNWIKFVAPK